ncbi:hypothetical protein PREVCOP_03911 [Segatella copri DSM 18205]|uniref:Uncharacterized protein n=1 Tax=Segatella copri DSM 18205 TaxID=537011 RepID=D1P9M8_9BACT|nr:hypothetical protein PREVCOP_03911 [Segatella copri DSM 18205]
MQQFYYYLAYHLAKNPRESYTISNIHMLHLEIIDNENRERSAFPIC